MVEYVNVRSSIQEEMSRFLVGPFETNEVLGEFKRPMQLYLSGKLVPFGSSSDVENEAENEIETNVPVAEETIEEKLTLRKIFRPSSMGISFKMIQLKPFTLKASWGVYEGEKHKRTSCYEEWKIDLSIENPTEILLNKNESKIGKVRYSITYRNSLYHISVFLYNSLERKSYPLQSEVMFQTKLEIEVDKGNLGIFTSKTDQFNLQDELLYREFEELAIGHGVGVDWNNDNFKVKLETTWLPFYELPVVEHTKIHNINLFMSYLSELNGEEQKRNLLLIPGAYKEWLDIQKEHIQLLPSYLHKVAMLNIQQVEKIISRLEQGITLVTVNNSNEQTAFQFANKAMMIQRAHSEVASAYRSSKKIVEPQYDSEWRLFQIIFLLMNISGSSDENHPDRQIVDLVWFPTGGGKTEAYLGVAAYTMAYRRLIADKDKVEDYAGITVFMRYTLRLLTTQQFQRATALICAAEVLRRQNQQLLGKEPFSIGIWIGAESSPNTFKDAAEKLDDLRNGKEVKSGNPIQLMHCPWCGRELTPNDYQVDVKNEKQTIRCNNLKCMFHKQLPVYTIDEAIYRKLPTLLIGTVDKIAQLPWKKNMHELFGMKNLYSTEYGFCYEAEKGKRGFQSIGRLKPPQLIIQDELHLISGPLGSLTGLYEVAVDLLTTNNGIPAKVIASTATISGANEQIKALYGREMMQFPLAVNRANDNFVSNTVNVKEKPGRLYMGICSPGVSNKIQAIQTFAAYITITRNLDKGNVDPYFTMLGYFNTVKELSGMLTTFKDEIVNRLDMLDPNKTFDHDLVVEEMTSRKKAQEIPELLTKLELTIDDASVLDAVLATNMISVGVDVDRLGTMIVQGQPKTTSEYIQATSRVGRKYPGLVLTVLNSMRSRDLSHFERFKVYHQALYRHVESMSVTPFASGALRKGLNGAFIGYMRQTLLEISSEMSANKITASLEVEEKVLMFIERVNKATDDSIEDEIRSVLNWWLEMAGKYEKMGYKKSKYGKAHLLKQFNENGKIPEAQSAMMSLRNVEGTIEIEVVTK